MAERRVPANTPSTTTTFARVLEEYRLRAGLSLGQLAQAARLSRTYVYHLERGQRAHPSAHAARALARALELRGAERQAFYGTVEALTGEPPELEEEPDELFDLVHLAELLVANTAYPTHAIDRLWRVLCWNTAAARLFQIDPILSGTRHPHLLSIIFDPAYRSRFRPWEPLARRLVADFKWNTAALTHLPEYRALWRELRALPDFRRLADVTPAAGVPGPSFVMGVQHPELGPLALRTAATLFSGVRDIHIVSYVPGDASTLEAYRRMGWQVVSHQPSAISGQPDSLL
jgi:transcriptional regulator with XRE-family HTH domain